MATFHDAALPLNPVEQQSPSFEKVCSAAKGRSRGPARSAKLLGVACLVASLYSADFLAFGRTWASELPSFGSWNGYAAEITLVVSVAMLLMMRSTDRKPKPEPSVRTRQDCCAADGGASMGSPDAARKTAANRRDGAGGQQRSVAIQARQKCTDAIEVAVRRGDREQAEQLLLEFERLGVMPDAMSYNLVIRACARRIDLVAAEKWLKHMEDKGLPATLLSYNTLLDACAKAGSVEACEKWFKIMMDKGIEPNVISFATVINACARRRNPAAAEQWLSKMSVAGIKPDAIAYSSLIHAYSVTGAPKDAERCLEIMESSGLEISVTTYTTVIDACAKCGDVERAEFWFAHMIEKGVEPNAVTFSAMIDCCAKAGKLARAEHWHGAMLERGIPPCAHSISAVINACAKQAGPESAKAAEKWLERSEQAGIPGDMVIYTSVIDACGKAGDAERALRVFRRMQAQGFKPQIYTYSALARPYGHRGDWVMVENIAQEMAGAGVAVNEFFLYAHLLAYAVARQGHRAELCFRSALGSGVKVNDYVATALARAVGRSRCTELMKELCGGYEVPQSRQSYGWAGRSSGAQSSTNVRVA